ncbi:hypothetical protein [Burkholderia savannae]|uniref:hypothetical protein n=1 Tax=Burkholderia savannae TaxID=1637837 RepID=UPI0012E3E6BE|nr:hypothetical protein [Burkholderia savannae]
MDGFGSAGVTWRRHSPFAIRRTLLITHPAPPAARRLPFAIHRSPIAHRVRTRRAAFIMRRAWPSRDEARADFNRRNAICAPASC